MHIFSDHQQKQVEVIHKLEKQLKNKTAQFTTVAPVENYATDSRICLTSLHFPQPALTSIVQETIIQPLVAIEPDFFFYPASSLHLTIKNIRVIQDPPSFTAQDIQIAQEVFSRVIPQHRPFSLYFYRLLLFENNLALVGTTDPELDLLIQDLNQELLAAGIPDDKVYVNSQYFFSNMTVARFSRPPSAVFIEAVEHISEQISIPPYTVDSITLLTGNATFTQKNIVQTWDLVKN